MTWIIISRTTFLHACVENRFLRTENSIKNSFFSLVITKNKYYALKIQKKFETFNIFFLNRMSITKSQTIKNFKDGLRY